MRIQLVSDLHLETNPEFMHADLVQWHIKSNADTLVVAGDTAPLAMPEDYVGYFMERASMLYKHVVWVVGNHEYYGAKSYRTAMNKARRIAEKTGTFLLNNSVVEIGGVKFLGGTMWYRPISDHRMIPWMMGQPHFEENLEFQRLLVRELNRDHVVVTHHMPTNQVVSPRYAGSPINGYFVSEEDGIIFARQPRAWLFGHTHSKQKIVLGRTIVACNPRGYPAENPDWDPCGTVIEV